MSPTVPKDDSLKRESKRLRQQTTERFLEPLDLKGRRMRAISNDANGVVSGDTILSFERKGDVISAHYLGGTIADGYLIGKQASATSIRFCYVQVDLQGTVDAGTSVGTIERLQDGRLRLTEAFQWSTRFGGGTNVFEEIGGTKVIKRSVFS